VTPNWLIPFGGRIAVMTTPTHTWQLDGDCLRDGSMLPTISMRDVLGPLTGFAADGTRWTSTTGGAAWQQFAARAQRSSNGAVTAMSGHGIGKILLPGGVVVRGDVTWEYTTQTHPAPDVLPSRCADVIFADLPLPDSWYNRRPYGGAFLAENDMPLARATSELVAFLPAHGWDAHISQRSNQSIVIQASRADETIQLFLVSNTNDGVELTAIVTP
jgi:hypothetical protein